MKDKILYGEISWEELMPKLTTTLTVGQDLKKGEKCEITQGGFVVPVFNKERKKEIIKSCLRYCRHRKMHHPQSGLGVNVKDIERVLEEMK